MKKNNMLLKMVLGGGYEETDVSDIAWKRPEMKKPTERWTMYDQILWAGMWRRWIKAWL
jgi:hypothetical protein